MNKEVIQEHRVLLSQIKKTVDNPNKSRDEKLQAISEYLANHVDVFDWVGFYLVDPEADRELILGPYVGEETEHTRIPFWNRHLRTGGRNQRNIYDTGCRAGR
ncbi:MAG: hypothetical protein U5J63_08760 [Fodinibius sp.]|nr:hypothetical protein [Fodinibius sp.]